MNFEEKIQQWVTIDNQIKLVNEKLKDLREKKSNIQQDVNVYVDKNNLTNATIQITDGKLKFVNTRVAPPLSFKYVEKSLSEIIKNEVQVRQIMEYLKDKREIKMVSEIKRFQNV